MIKLFCDYYLLSLSTGSKETSFKLSKYSFHLSSLSSLSSSPSFLSSLSSSLSSSSLPPSFHSILSSLLQCHSFSPLRDNNNGDDNDNNNDDNNNGDDNNNDAQTSINEMTSSFAHLPILHPSPANTPIDIDKDRYIDLDVDKDKKEMAKGKFYEKAVKKEEDEEEEEEEENGWERVGYDGGGYISLSGLLLDLSSISSSINQIHNNTKDDRRDDKDDKKEKKRSDDKDKRGYDKGYYDKEWEKMEMKRMKRDQTSSYHITLFTSSDLIIAHNLMKYDHPALPFSTFLDHLFSSLSSLLLSNDNNNNNNNNNNSDHNNKVEIKWKNEGMGRIIERKGGEGGEGEIENEVYFNVIEWEEIQLLRAKYSLPPKDLHVTLAFSDHDIHSVFKDRSFLL